MQKLNPIAASFGKMPCQLFVSSVAVVFFVRVLALPAPPSSAASVIALVDAAVQARNDRVASYNVTEHYAVYRGSDETHPAAEMTVHTAYQRDSGKNYTVLSESGSEFIRNHVLHAILDNEKQINLPANRERSWLTSANYLMTLNAGGLQTIDGRSCYALSITPRGKAPNMIVGTIWVDAKTGSIVRIQGVTSQSPSVFSGPAQVMRQYINVNGYAMAVHAHAVSNSFLVGRTVVAIDYSNYQLQTRPSH